MLSIITSLLIYTENGHQYDSEQKKTLILVRDNTIDIEVPASVEEIVAGSTSNSAFSLCAKNIKTVKFQKGSLLHTFGDSLLRETSVEVVDFSNCDKLLKINNGCCMKCQNLKTFNFPPNVEEVCYGAFCRSSIKEVTFPDSLKYIYPWHNKFGGVFEGSDIAHVHISKKSQLETIDDHVFIDCSYLSAFFIPKSVTKLGSAVFIGSPIKKFTIDDENPNYSTDGRTIYNKNGTTIISITSYNFNDNYVVRKNITKIGSQAFRSVPSKTVIFENQNVIISDAAFFGTGVEEINYPTGQTKVVPAFAKESNSLKKIVLGDNIETIGENAFALCTNLKEVVVSNNLKTIEVSAFLSCHSLLNLKLPASLQTISTGAFSNCNSGIVFDIENNQHIKLENGILYCGSTFVDYIKDAEENQIIIPNNIVVIPNGMFKAKKLQSVTFNEVSQVTTIGKEAFAGSTIRSVVFAPSITEIGERCFASCPNLESVEFDGTISTISSEAFTHCVKLTTFSIKASNQITTIDTFAFYNCKELTTFNFENLASLKTIGESAFAYSKLPPFNFPKSITEIKPHAFESSLIEKITFTDECTMENITNYCFYNCSQLKNCKLSSQTKTIGLYAFSGCTSLEDFQLGSGIELIQQYAFSGSTMLTTVVIPADSKLKYIMGHAFQKTSLTTFEIIDGADFSFKDGLLMNGAKTLLIYFVPNEKVKMVVIPGTIKRIGDYAFQHVTHLREVFIPEGVFYKIGYASFQGCTSLKRITLPSTFREIENDAFSECDKILCGGLFMDPSMKEKVKAAGIKDLPLSPNCLNNYDPLLIKKTCKVYRHRINILFSSLFLTLLA